MRIICCTQCGGNTPEGFSLCPACMKRAGAGEAEVIATIELLEIAGIANMGDTDASRRTAIESILNIKNRMEGKPNAKKEKAQAPPQKAHHLTATRTSGQPTHAEDSGD